MITPELFEKIRTLPNATAILKDALALKYEPIYFTIVEVPEGTEMRYGGVNGHPGWGQGHAVQFEITGRWEEEWFSESERIEP